MSINGREETALSSKSHRLNRSQSTNRRNATGADRAGYLIATGFGAGFVPIAPGTVGAIQGASIFLAIHLLKLEQASSLVLLAVINIILFVVGVWASNRTCDMTAAADPHIIVIDEVSGQLIALTPVAFLRFSWAAVIVGFLLFRLFDIFKPYPIRRLERLHQGLGVMADDALAGIYAGALLWGGLLLGLL